jgi:hypothetical protein
MEMPAFKFVLIFIALLLSHFLKAVRMPIAKTQNSNAADCPESIALNGDGGWHHTSGTHRATFAVPLPTIQSDRRVKEMDRPEEVKMPGAEALRQER